MITPATLTLTVQALAFSDPQTASNNPQLQNFNWRRFIQNLSITNPSGVPRVIPAGATVTIFNGTDATTLDGTTAFTMTLSALDPSRYRFTWTGGTNPTLRTGRGVNLSTIATTLVVNANATVTVTAASGTPFASVQPGDTVFIPGPSTGDAPSPFNVSNQGYWVVLAVPSSTVLTLTRPTGTPFLAVGETQTPATAAQFDVFSAAGVQIGDGVDISAGFSPSNQRTFTIVAVTDSFFEVESTTPLPLDAAITPGASGMVFFNTAYRYLYLEGDQEAAVRCNGATDNRDRLSSLNPGDPATPSLFLKTGYVWSLVVVNRSSQVLNLLVQTAS